MASEDAENTGNAEGTERPESTESTDKPRTPYGAELRRRRIEAGLTQATLSERAFMTRTHIAHIEAGRRTPSLEDARRLDQVLETGGVFVAFWPTLNQRPVAVHFEAARQFEQQASAIREYGGLLIPGLLQTEGYMRALFRSHFPPKTADRCDTAAATRLDRAQIFNDPISPTFMALLDEAALRRSVGGPSTMAEQLRHIVSLGERDRIRVHVIPFGIGSHAVLSSNLTLTWFDDMPPVAYSEAVYTGTVMDESAMVYQCQTAYDLALGDALSHDQSLALIKAIAEEYENAHQ
ncbi:Scr1 family TA system antitoxin-like transcriptional regulator [Streptomyces sp. NPDC051018]|uniref:helix-turn-helix domain-containing protein n=1 Tax=Streptomyces sp. NPDC051018 TaxID=3365639 RepID=UPI00379F39CA